MKTFMPNSSVFCMWFALWRRLYVCACVEWSVSTQHSENECSSNNTFLTRLKHITMNILYCLVSWPNFVITLIGFLFQVSLTWILAYVSAHSGVSNRNHRHLKMIKSQNTENDQILDHIRRTMLQFNNNYSLSTEMLSNHSFIEADYTEGFKYCF